MTIPLTATNGHPTGGDPLLPHHASTTTDILADTSPGPFEGPEKLLEIWFAPSADELPREAQPTRRGLTYRDAPEQGDKKAWQGLRRVPRETWEDMLRIVRCQVLSVIEGEEVDAYLLSTLDTARAGVFGKCRCESSLFVAPHLVILKTCGTTINLLGLNKIIDIAREYCGFQDVWRNWQQEVSFLDGVFDHKGAAYTVGPMNGDHWLLYLTSPSTRLAVTPSDHKLPRAISAAAGTTRQPSPSPRRRQDQTLEILMTHLAPSARAPFFHPAELDPTRSSSSEEASLKARSGHHLGAILTTHLGIDQLFPREETTIDAFGFEPCGYSANGIVGSGSSSSDEKEEGEGGGYFTIHVTPEEGWSFASFECNVPLPISAVDNAAAAATTTATATRPDLQTLIRKVIDIFQPGRLSITLFLSTPSEDEAATAGEPLQEEDPARQAWSAFSKSMLGNGYVRQDRIGYEFEGYDLVFGCFERRGFEGGKLAVAPDV
ncbi:hypothetical protein QFC22_006240 [Naganishia vaughanmartiniae]|uniref:Uncharacterized protein n=1 Tax=Naganishia vaughanmartiniae TaxID=1424756 RepID=A0ACC2WMP7_9TREE|nr:hypothetical protein QFC22_006240 [Naganishia vaughanmartiniae]